MERQATDTQERCERPRVRAILDGVVEGVVHRTPFRRAVACVFGHGVAPGDRTKTGVLEISSLGLTPKQMERIAEFSADASVSGERYREAYRIGRSYYFRRGEGLQTTALQLPSNRTYLNREGWNERDVLLVPFWFDGKILGHISADDPTNGQLPSRAVLERLEDIASLAAVGICQACDMVELTEHHHLFRCLADSAMTGLLVVREERIRYVNGRACEVLGFAKEDILSLAPWWQVVHPDDRPKVWSATSEAADTVRILRAVRRDGRIVWLALNAYPMAYEKGDALAIQFFDLTERIETENLLKERALHDPLTGLLNRGYFEDGISKEVSRSQRYKRPLTLMIGDLTGFKEVNDRLGHQEGDRILVGVASVFRHQLRASDWVVRYGGDEFLFVLPETGGDVEAIEARLCDAVGAWCAAESRDGVRVEIDFGWATWTAETPRSVSDLLHEADEMLYRKKSLRARSGLRRTAIGHEERQAAAPDRTGGPGEQDDIPRRNR